MLKLAAIAAAVPTALLAGVASLGVMVVDVREEGPGGHHFVVPVPLVVAQTALSLVPSERVRVEMDEAARHLPVAREVLEALAAGPDGELVRVEEQDKLVVITKKRGTLRVRVREKASDVDVNVPLSMALAALPDEQGRISGSRIAGTLWSARFTDLVDVRNGQTQVSVSIW